jgi:transcriptional regulator of acetoin/glycerol metabolism
MMQFVSKAIGPQTRIDLLDRQGHVRKLEDIEAEVLRVALASQGGSVFRAALSLGIGRSTFYRRLPFLKVS